MSGDLTPEEQEAFDRIHSDLMGIRGALGLSKAFPKVDTKMVQAVIMSLRETLKELDEDENSTINLDFVEDPDDKTVMILGFSENWVATIIQGLLRLLNQMGEEKFLQAFGWLGTVPELDKGATEGETPS